MDVWLLLQLLTRGSSGVVRLLSLACCPTRDPYYKYFKLRKMTLLTLLTLLQKST